MDTKGLQKEFLSWCKSKNKSPKTEDETKQLFVAFMKEKHPEEYKQAVQNQQKQQQAQAQKAAHGAKLNYFKSLKNQCAKDEEVVYYKKGGSVGCGCKKKEDGGQVATAKEGSAIAKFKAARKMQAGKKMEQKKEGWDNKGNYIVTKAGIEERKKQLEANKNEEGQAAPKKQETKPQTKPQPKQPIKKGCNGAVAKFKMHRQGGSLNGIPFMQQGTFKGGVQYRFRRSTNDMNNGYKTYSDQIMMTQDPLGHQTYDTPPISAGRTIYVTPQGNDTIFYTNNDYIFDKTPKGDLNQKKAKQKFYQLIKKAPIEGEEYRMTPYWNSNLFNLDAVRNRALKGN